MKLTRAYDLIVDRVDPLSRLEKVEKPSRLPLRSLSGQAGVGGSDQGGRCLLTLALSLLAFSAVIVDEGVYISVVVDVASKIWLVASSSASWCRVEWRELLD
jgi:hypothetical protein